MSKRTVKPKEPQQQKTRRGKNRSEKNAVKKMRRKKPRGKNREEKTASKNREQKPQSKKPYRQKVKGGELALSALTGTKS